jgi:hypothetical protein
VYKRANNFTVAPPGKHSLRKDDYLTTIMLVPPKQRSRIAPFDMHTQEDAFTVSPEGLKGVGDCTFSLEDVAHARPVEHQRFGCRIGTGSRRSEKTGMWSLGRLPMPSFMPPFMNSFSPSLAGMRSALLFSEGTQAIGKATTAPAPSTRGSNGIRNSNTVTRHANTGRRYTSSFRGWDPTARCLISSACNQ